MSVLGEESCTNFETNERDNWWWYISWGAGFEGEGGRWVMGTAVRCPKRKIFIYPAVYKTDTTHWLIVTEISKPAVCWVGWEVAAAAVWSITHPLVFLLKALEKPLGAREKWSEVENASNLSLPLSSSPSVGLPLPFPPPLPLILYKLWELLWAQWDEKVCICWDSMRESVCSVWERACTCFRLSLDKS